MATSRFHVGQRLFDPGGVDVLAQQVADGGFGMVAMGPNQGNDSFWLAIKALRPDLLAPLNIQPGGDSYAAAETRLRALFIREALTWVGLWPHPNLLTAHGVVPINGEPMLVLDYAEQGSLRDLFITAQSQNDWLTLDTALEIAQQIAAGLVALHTPNPGHLRDQPIVHRDLKPENILLSRGFAKITDFGLAKAVTEATSDAASTADVDSMDTIDAFLLPATPTVATTPQVYHTQRGALLGTPAYMAPEQWVDARLAGPPADAYAFGLILTELCAGCPPLLPLKGSTTAEWRMAHLAGRPTLLRLLGADIFAAERATHAAGWGARQQTALEQVEGLVARLLAKRAAARPTLAEALAVLQAAALALGERSPYTPPAEFYPPTEEHQVIFWRGWAGAYERFGLHAEALACIERAWALAPEDPDVLTSYGAILGGMGRQEEALVVERRALGQAMAGDQRLRSGRWSNVGAHLYLQRRYDEAEEAYDKAVRLDPFNANTWYNRAGNAGQWAEAEQAAGRIESARNLVEAGLSHISQALRLNPDHSGYRQAEQVLLRHREQLRAQRWG